ncbi:VOC family protein [Aquihabitans sp. G128]|uniref:VOC family protein n=1 Tax=Aquihabitans sp. G128 TaxID=2849779 RepID=UPI001C21E9FF|nr:VOC family protein [Aquihabitans sp. G128]QXC62935.1 VOC family protein [Aquihabitans sp. G128]
MGEHEPVRSISALTLATADMAACCAFYEALGFVRLYGGPDAAFTSYRVGGSFLNLQHVDDPPPTGWGRAVLHVEDVDALFDRARAAGFTPSTAPADAPWGERYFHLSDPTGHELSFARPLTT